MILTANSSKLLGQAVKMVFPQNSDNEMDVLDFSVCPPPRFDTESYFYFTEVFKELLDEE